MHRLLASLCVPTKKSNYLNQSKAVATEFDFPMPIANRMQFGRFRTAHRPNRADSKYFLRT